MSQYAAVDSDDRPGYLMDYIKSWAHTYSITDRNAFNESFQSDEFQDTLQDFAEEVLEIAGVI